MSPEEYFGTLLPLGGNPGTVSEVSVPISTVATSVNLDTLFGNIDQGSHLTVKADGPLTVPSGLTWKAYFSLGPRAGTVGHGWSGATPSGLQGWPLLDGQEKQGHLLTGRAVTTGFATALSHKILHGVCTVGSGFLRVYRSTLPQGFDAGQLRPPVPSAIFPPGPSGWYGPLP